IEREALRQLRARLVLEEAERAVERDPWRNHSLHANRVQLLELLELARLCGGPQARERRERHELAVRTRDVDPLQLFGRESIAARDLRDHLVAAAIDAEAVHVITSEHRGEVESGLLQVDTLRAHLVAIEHDLALRLVELQVGVGKDEQTAR